MCEAIFKFYPKVSYKRFSDDTGLEMLQLFSKPYNKFYPKVRAYTLPEGSNFIMFIWHLTHKNINILQICNVNKTNAFFMIYGIIEL